MKLYLTVIGMAMLAISAFNIVFDTAPWYYIVIAVVVCTAMQFALDGLIAVIVNKMPNTLFGVDNPLYNVSEKEKNLYKKLKVRIWKDRVWDLGGLGGFSKKNLADPNSPEYIERFIVESHKGVVTHRLSYPVGFLAMLFLPDVLAVSVAFPVAVVNLILNILPTLSLRYSTPKLKLLLARMRRKEKTAESSVG